MIREGQERKNPEAERAAREARRFGRFVRWVPIDLPSAAVPFWPRKDSWPSVADIRRLVDATESDPDARLGVMTGLRRWAEPGSSQMLVSLGTIVVAIVAVAVGVSDFDPSVFVLVVFFGAIYLLFALVAFGQAVKVDERRKMAHGWLKAIEDELNMRAIHATPEIPLTRRPWFEAKRF